MLRRPPFAAALCLALATAPLSQGLAQALEWEDELFSLRHRWERVTTELAPERREAALESLAEESASLAESHPQQSLVLVWRGIILASHAREAGGLAALGSAKEARRLLERAVELDSEGHNGSAWVTLGALYHRAPGWPVAFGDAETADEMFRRALAIRPQGIDVNYYYAAFLEDEDRHGEAREHARRAVDGQVREARRASDEALRGEARALLERL